MACTNTDPQPTDFWLGRSPFTKSLLHEPPGPTRDSQKAPSSCPRCRWRTQTSLWDRMSPGDSDHGGGASGAACRDPLKVD